MLFCIGLLDWELGDDCTVGSVSVGLVGRESWLVMAAREASMADREDVSLLTSNLSDVISAEVWNTAVGAVKRLRGWRQCIEDRLSLASTFLVDPRVALALTKNWFLFLSLLWKIYDNILAHWTVNRPLLGRFDRPRLSRNSNREESVALALTAILFNYVSVFSCKLFFTRFFMALSRSRSRLCLLLFFSLLDTLNAG